MFPTSRVTTAPFATTDRARDVHRTQRWIGVLVWLLFFAILWTISAT
ncbi:MAG: hypothetical protein ACKVWV_15780 [Planctomycetota bacterium]